MVYKFILGRHIKTILNDAEEKQKQDIKDYAGGHLNESVLLRAPVLMKHKTWASAHKESIDLTKPVKSQHQPRVSRDERSAQDALYDFALGISGVIPSVLGSASKIPEIRYRFIKDTKTEEGKLPRPRTSSSLYSELDDRVLVEEIPLAELMNLDHRIHQTTTSNDASDGQLSFARDSMFASPGSFLSRKTQLELSALHKHSASSVHSQGMTKADYCRKLKASNVNVLQANEAYEKLKTLQGEKTATHCKQTLTQVEKKNLNTVDPDLHDLQVASNVLDNIIKESPTFSYILHCIKTEYNNYIVNLLKNQQPHPDYLRSQIDQMISRGTSKPEEMEAARHKLQSLEAETKYSLNMNQRLKEQVKSELDSLTRNPEVPAVKKPATDGSLGKEQPAELSKSLEHMKALILEKMDDLNALHHQTRTEYVPVTVCTHLEQCIKETEVEVQKLLKQNEYFERSIAEMESELEDAIVEADTSEKDARRIWRKVNSRRGIPGVQNNKGTESDEDNDDESKWNWYIS